MTDNDEDLRVVPISLAEAMAAEIIHASQERETGPLCGQERYVGEAVLNLSHPWAKPHRNSVNCQGCLEWMHA